MNECVSVNESVHDMPVFCVSLFTTITATTTNTSQTQTRWEKPNGPKWYFYHSFSVLSSHSPFGCRPFAELGELSETNLSLFQFSSFPILYEFVIGRWFFFLCYLRLVTDNQVLTCFILFYFIIFFCLVRAIVFQMLFHFCI